MGAWARVGVLCKSAAACVRVRAGAFVRARACTRVCKYVHACICACFRVYQTSSQRDNLFYSLLKFSNTIHRFFLFLNKWL